MVKMKDCRSVPGAIISPGTEGRSVHGRKRKPHYRNDTFNLRMASKASPVFSHVN